MMQRWLNPIIVSEMKTRMRGRRFYILLTLYLIVLSCMVGMVYVQIFESSGFDNHLYNLSIPNVQDGPTIGKSVFGGTVFLLLILISHIAPAFTAAAISGERERQTYEILVITPLRARRIVLGKLGSIFLFLLLLIMTSLPLQSVAFLFGGVAFLELLISTLVLVITALAFGAFGLYISSLNRKTMTAIIATYSVLLPFIYGVPFILGFVVSFGISTVTILGVTNYQLLSIIYGVVLAYIGGFILCLNPFTAAIATMAVAANGKGYFFFSEQVAYNLTLPFISPWVVYVVVYAALTLWLIRLTTKRLERVNKS